MAAKFNRTRWAVLLARESRDFEAGALVENLRDFYVARRAVGDFGLDGWQPLERRTKSDVQDHRAFAGRKFGQQRAVDRLAAVGRA